jgi:hypothetical protein
MFTSRHYKRLAWYCAQANLSLDQVEQLCCIFTEDNPKFSYERFRDAVDTERAKIHANGFSRPPFPL